MIFNSFAFLVFFVTVFIIYALLPQKGQNRFLLAASYFFYAAWDYRFCLLLLITTTVDYIAGRYVSGAGNHKKLALGISITVNLTILCFFKYFNFFQSGLIDLIAITGVRLDPIALKIILPVGISFYTFQSMSYTIDLYRKEISPVKNFFDYALYVSFFPQLVAGPIERAKTLLPQIVSSRKITVTGIQRGFYFISIGLFLKIFVADNIAGLVDPIFIEGETRTGLEYLLGGYGFTFQIYGDFAGYSYVAMGLGAILGFKIMNNFNLPYFSTNPQEFWRRWHISLSTWLRDYLYIPLGGSRSASWKTGRNLMITMLLGGLWHGAKITFVLWGGIHGLLLILFHYFQLSKDTGKSNRLIGNVRVVIMKFLKIFVFFHVIVATWYFFRANSVQQVQVIFEALFFNLHFSGSIELAGKLACYIAPLLMFQLLQYVTDDRDVLFRLPIIVRSITYVVIFYLVVIFGVNHAQDFIYFQF